MLLYLEQEHACVFFAFCICVLCRVFVLALAMRRKSCSEVTISSLLSISQVLHGEMVGVGDKQENLELRDEIEGLKLSLQR